MLEFGSVPSVRIAINRKFDDGDNAMTESYADPELLVETEWLAAHMSDPGLRIIDADYPESFARAHIPGAVSQISRNIYLKTADGDTFIMGPDQFAATMSRMGIGDDNLVVVYDSHSSLYATRFWWALNFYGHANVKVLNGGWHKWLLEGRPVTMTVPSVTPATFTPRQDDSIHASCERLVATVGRDDAVILDTRTDGEWLGKNDRGNKRKGHVPGAVHLEWVNFVTDDDSHVFKPAQELRSMLVAAGVRSDRDVITYCQGGIRAAHAFFTLKLVGFANVRNYDGSMRDWANREETPLVIE